VKYVLKTYKVIICSVLCIAFYVGSSLPISAETITNKESISEYEIFEMEENFMEEFKDLDDCVNVKVKIYSQDNRLVRCGSEKSEMIKDLIKRADFLADVGGIEFYRLNK
jgi:hypothetical protein